MPETPKYHLVDVPHRLRCRVLDLCCRGLLDDALELLEQDGFHHYTRDDLVKFYVWAPDPLPNEEPKTALDNPRDCPPPSPEVLGDICKRLNQLPPELARQVDQDLRIKEIQHVGKFLWDAGFPFTTGDLCEYRKSLFPPNAMVDPHSAGPPVLRQEFSERPIAPPTPDAPRQSDHEASLAIQPVTCSTASTVEQTDIQSPNSDLTSPPPIPAATIVSECSAADHGQPTTDQSAADADPEPEAAHSEPEPAAPSPPLIPKRRGKISGLPKAIRQRVNEMLDEGSTYEAIVEWLDQNGFPSVNKVNLHNWHKGGFQDWLREQERIENQSAQREWLGDVITQSEPGDLHHCIYTLFASQIMDSLFGINTAKLKEGLSARPRDYIALMNGFRRMDKELTTAPEFQDFLKRKRQRKEGGGMSADMAYAILREMRLSHLVERALECDEFKDRRKVKPG